MSAVQASPGALVPRAWTHRWLLWEWMRRDAGVRYRQTALGLGWALVQPLFLLAFYGVVFHYVLRTDTAGVPFVLFAYCGLASWVFVSTAVTLGVPAMLNAQAVLTKVWFPREVIPLAAVGVSVVDLAVNTAILLVLVVVLGSGLHWSALALLPVLAGLVLITAGVVTAVSALTVFLRDLRQGVALLLQGGFIASPVMYSPDLVPDGLRGVYDLNPVAVAITATRTALLDGRWPSAAALLVPLVVGAALLLAATAYVRSVEGRIADVL